MLSTIIAISCSFKPQTNLLAQFTYRTVEALLANNQLPSPPSKTPTKGVFVTIESNGKVLGCRGTLEPSEPTLENQIQNAAKSATLFDPRYHGVHLGKMPFSVTLTIVDRFEPISSVSSLLAQDGLILRSKLGVGIVLPYEGKDPFIRLEWAYRKAMAPREEPVRLERLFAERFRYPELK